VACPVCTRPAGEPFVAIEGVPVHVSTLHRTPAAARNAPRGDLRLALCDGCGLIWNVAYDDALVGYDGDYENSLDHSPAFAGYVAALAERLVARYGLREARVVEIGCGQADFLRRLCDAGGNVGVGYDPSYVGPPVDGQVTVHRELYSGADDAPDFVCCRHVLEHVERPLELVRGLRGTLDAAPVFFEVPNGEHQLANGVVWDMIYAHHSTFTAPSLRALFEAGGFEVLELGTAFGGQYLWIEARPAPHTAATAQADGVAHVRALADRFAAGYDELIRGWRRQIDGLEGRRVALWGAGAKGVSLLNALGDGAGIGRVVDLNPRKHGSFVPGCGTPVVAPESLTAYEPDVVLLSNPIYADEVRALLAGLGLEPEIAAAGIPSSMASTVG
jgi:methyltransferase family protein/C-methyltransferase-like protein